MILKNIAKWGLVGALTMPVAFVLFNYAYGLAVRPDEMSTAELFSMINDTIWRWDTFLESILPIWMPIGGILGVVGSLFTHRKKKS
ncbi:MAG: fumarate reductase subunit D [Limisphaerales bacterium]|jgi:fumarate reductase subunit D